MNEIQKLFNDIPDEELREAILEIKESDVTGYVKENGYVRKYGRLTGELTRGVTTTDFFMTTINLLKQAAYRWTPLIGSGAPINFNLKPPRR
jgi:hypothetical protein